MSDTPFRPTRRQLLVGGAATAVAAGAGMAIERTRIERLLGTGTAHASSDKGILVLVTLYGGNDGLNTVIPLENSTYAQARGALAYKPEEALPLGDGLGLHPNLKGLKAMWDAKQLAVIRGVGYPNPNRSHFRSQDIWQSAVPDKAVTSGWIGRWQDRHGGDPLTTVSIGSTVPLALVGEKSAATAIPTGSFTVPGGTILVDAFTALNGPAQATQSPLAQAIAQSGADLLHATTTVAKVEAAHPAAKSQATTANSLQSQLDLVATLIAGGLPTRVYAVSQSSYDTHADEKATHARLLGDLDTALGHFFSQLRTAKQDHNVTVLVYSEFGRRVAVNGSGGTDHGTAAPVFVAGTPVRGGFYGEEPSLTDLDAGDLKFNVDFRSVYATVIERVLGTDSEPVLGGKFASLRLL